MQTKLQNLAYAQQSSVQREILPAVNGLAGVRFSRVTNVAVNKGGHDETKPADRHERKNYEDVTQEGGAMVLVAQKVDQTSDVDFYVRCQKVARAKGYCRDVWEDFPAWAFERMKLGSRARIDHLLIDYLRTTYGVSGSDGQRLRKAVAAASSNADAVDLTAAQETSLPSARIEAEDLWSLAEGQDRDMLQLYFIDGLSKKEIGELFGVTEARISQRMKALLARLKTLLLDGG